MAPGYLVGRDPGDECDSFGCRFMDYEQPPAWARQLLVNPRDIFGPIDPIDFITELYEQGSR